MLILFVFHNCMQLESIVSLSPFHTVLRGEAKERAKEDKWSSSEVLQIQEKWNVMGCFEWH